MASEARINIYASDHAGATIKSVQGGLRGMAAQAKGSLLAGVGLGGGVLAFTAMTSAVSATVDIIKTAITSAQEEQVSIQKLTTAIEANVVGWDGNTDSIEDVIEARMRLGFSDDEQRNSLAILIAATGDISQALEIQATAMDLARLKGIDLATASDALTRVEGGSYRILKSLGIVLADGATATEALAAVQAVAAGQAEDYSTTSAGAYDALNVAIGELMDQIGALLIGPMTDMAVFLREEMVPAVEDLIEVIQIIPWGMIASGIETIILPFTTFLQVIRGLQQALGLLPTDKGGGTFAPTPRPTGGRQPGNTGFPGGIPPVTVHINGRELQESTATWDYYTSTGGNSRFPR